MPPTDFHPAVAGWFAAMSSSASDLVTLAVLAAGKIVR